MKTKLLSLALFILAQLFFAQNINGSWMGEIDIQGMKLPLILKVKQNGDTYSSVAVSPKQDEREIPVDETTFQNNELIFNIKSLNATYKGQFIKDHFEGNFSQNGHVFPLNLTKQTEADSKKSYAIPPIGERQIDTKRIDNFLNDVAKYHQGIGSVSIFRHGKEIYRKDFGQKQLPIKNYDKNTGYQVGSISKLFTAVMLMQQVEKGKLKLTDKLSKFYPQMPNADKITIENMMNHTSGLGNYNDGRPDWLFNKFAGNEKILNKIKQQGVSFQPGEKTEYSNSAYFLLSRVLEKISGKPYNVLLKENISDKAGLKNTFSVLDNPKNSFKAYDFDGKNWSYLQDFDFHNAIGLGDIISTTTDLNLFINALFQNKLVKKETLKEMLPVKSAFGLGIMGIPFYNIKSYGHGGDTVGQHSSVNFDPANDLSIAITINGERMYHNDLAIAVLSIIYDVKDYKLPDFSKIYEPKATDLDSYIGVYSSPKFPIELSFTKKGTILIVQGTDQPPFPLDAVAKDEFKIDRLGLKIKFLPKENKLSLTQGGESVELSKK